MTIDKQFSGEIMRAGTFLFNPNYCNQMNFVLQQ